MSVSGAGGNKSVGPQGPDPSSTESNFFRQIWSTLRASYESLRSPQEGVSLVGGSEQTAPLTKVIARAGDNVTLRVIAAHPHEKYLVPLRESGRGDFYTLEELARLSSHYAGDVAQRVEKITIKPHHVALPTSECDYSDVKVCQQSAPKLMQYWLNIFTNPVKCCQLLGRVEKAFAEEMQRRGLHFDENDRPKYMVAGRCYFHPGPPVKGEEGLKQKGRIVDSVLSKLEEEQGLGKAATFGGFVDPEHADKFIGEGHLFKEHETTSTLLHHGKNTHRLAFQIIMASLEDAALDEEIKKELQEQGVTAKDILNLLLDVQIRRKPAWNFLIDIATDHTKGAQEYDVKAWNYSCRSPFIMQSLLLCFGDQLGLPCLMSCLRDSYWKSSYEMAKRIREKGENIDPDAAYLMVHAVIKSSFGGVQNLGQKFPFADSHMEMVTSPKYDGKYGGQYGILYKLPRGEELTQEMNEDKILSLFNSREFLHAWCKKKTEDADNARVVKFLQNAPNTSLSYLLFDCSEKNPALMRAILANIDNIHTMDTLRNIKSDLLHFNSKPASENNKLCLDILEAMKEKLEKT